MICSEQIANITLEYYSRFCSMYQDIVHTQQVVCYTRLIAQGQGLSPEKIALLESAAWLHDIGCPRSVELYGNSQPVNQQNVGREVCGELLGEEFNEWREYLCDVVGTHHQFDKAKQLDYLPLFEADLIVNLLSGYHKPENAEHLFNTLMTTKTGKQLFRTLIK